MPTPYDPAYIPGLNPVQPTGGLDPAYLMGISPTAQPFAAGAGGIMPGTPGSMGLIPPMPQMAIPGLSPYGPAITGTQSMMPIPMGGQWNQLAQQMAGPMFMPPHPSAGIPYPNPVMHGGGPIATVAAPKPPAPPVTAPRAPISSPLLGAGGGLMGGGGAGYGGAGYFGGGLTFPRISRL